MGIVPPVIRLSNASYKKEGIRFWTNYELTKCLPRNFLYGREGLCAEVSLSDAVAADCLSSSRSESDTGGLGGLQCEYLVIIDASSRWPVTNVDDNARGEVAPVRVQART